MIPNRRWGKGISVSEGIASWSTSWDPNLYRDWFLNGGAIPCDRLVTPRIPNVSESIQLWKKITEKRKQLKSEPEGERVSGPGGRWSSPVPSLNAFPIITTFHTNTR